MSSEHGLMAQLYKCGSSIFCISHLNVEIINQSIDLIEFRPIVMERSWSGSYPLINIRFNNMNQPTIINKF
jgi:hypothetical protein